MKTQVFATGATGLVGSRFVEMYEGEYEVINLDLTTGVDITNPETIVKVMDEYPKAKTMIHLAAFTDTNKAMEQKGDKSGLCYLVNVVGTKNIAEACMARGVHLIHISTDFVFDGKKETPYLETDPTSPIEWYGETKALAEVEVSKSQVSATIIRIAYPYRATYALKPDIIGKVRAGLELGKLYPQFSDSTITPTLIDDIARGFNACIKQKPKGIFHIVGSTSLSPFELAKKVAKAYGFDESVVKEGSLTEYLKTATRPFARSVAVSNQKAVVELGLTFVDIDTGLEEIKKQQA